MTHQQAAAEKIITPDKLAALLDKWRHANQKIVFTNGCFDLLHLGHMDYLTKAADLGDRLFIGVNTDASVNKLKGPHRPIQDENSRLHLLAALECVSAVMLFDEPTPYELIKTIQPDVLVKGSDYQPENIVGYDVVTLKGGKVTTIDYLPGYSTSAIEQKIKNS